MSAKPHSIIPSIVLFLLLRNESIANPQTDESPR